MQEDHNGLNEEIRELESQRRAILRDFDRIDGRLQQLRAQQGANQLTPEARRDQIRQRTREIGKRILGATGIALLLDWFRTHPMQAVAAAAFTAAAVFITAAVLPDDGLGELLPGGDPPAAVGTPTSEPPGDKTAAAPSPGPDDDAAAPSGPPFGSGEPGAGSTSASSGAGASPTSSPTGTDAPLPPSPSGTPTPSPTPTRPPSTPTPEPTATSPPPTPTPSPTITRPPDPTVSPTPTATPTSTPPVIPQECLLFLDIPALLEVCLLDLAQGGSGQLLDGAVGGRTLFG